MIESFVDVLKSRRSVRSFRPDEISDAIVARLITAGTMAGPPGWSALTTYLPFTTTAGTKVRR